MLRVSTSGSHQGPCSPGKYLGNRMHCGSICETLPQSILRCWRAKGGGCRQGIPRSGYLKHQGLPCSQLGLIVLRLGTLLKTFLMQTPVSTYFGIKGGSWNRSSVDTEGLLYLLALIIRCNNTAQSCTFSF